MSELTDFHRSAMSLIDQALSARRNGFLEDAKRLFESAFVMEKMAAEICARDSIPEPTFSTIYRSAAYLAFDCGKLDQAKQLASVPLAGQPPEEIAAELRTLLETIEGRPRFAGTATGRPTLLNDVEIQGSIHCSSEFFFDGRIEGAIFSNSTLTLGENAEVRGEIRARIVILLGTVHGNITAKERCELREHSVLHGDLEAARLVIEEGATFVGKSVVTPQFLRAQQGEGVVSEPPAATA